MKRIVFKIIFCIGFLILIAFIIGVITITLHGEYPEVSDGFRRSLVLYKLQQAAQSTRQSPRSKSTHVRYQVQHTIPRLTAARIIHAPAIAKHLLVSWYQSKHAQGLVC